MAKHALWIHGHAVRAQREGYALSKIYLGWGAVYKTQGGEWFQVAIPTPVIVGSIDTTLQKVFVLFRTIGTAKITSVHVWDGPTKIQAFDGLALSGDHLSQLDSDNSWNVNPVHIKWGLGISVHVDFGPPSQVGVPEITFASAGADFVTP
jgi:Family of unknown function (DUF6623)